MRKFSRIASGGVAPRPWSRFPPPAAARPRRGFLGLVLASFRDTLPRDHGRPTGWADRPRRGSEDGTRWCARRNACANGRLGCVRKEEEEEVNRPEPDCGGGDPRSWDGRTDGPHPREVLERARARRPDRRLTWTHQRPIHGPWAMGRSHQPAAGARLLLLLPAAADGTNEQKPGKRGPGREKVPLCFSAVPFRNAIVCPVPVPCEHAYHLVGGPPPHANDVGSLLVYLPDLYNCRSCCC